MVYNFFFVATHAYKSVFTNERLAEELQKPIIKKFKKEQSVLHLNNFGVLI